MCYCFGSTIFPFLDFSPVFVCTFLLISAHICSFLYMFWSYFFVLILWAHNYVHANCQTFCNSGGHGGIFQPIPPSTILLDILQALYSSLRLFQALDYNYIALGNQQFTEILSMWWKYKGRQMFSDLNLDSSSLCFLFSKPAIQNSSKIFISKRNSRNVLTHKKIQSSVQKCQKCLKVKSMLAIIEDSYIVEKL